MGTNPHQSHLLSATTHLHFPSIMVLPGLKVSPYFSAYNLRLGANPNGVLGDAKPNICCALNMAAGRSGDPEKINLDQLTNKGRKLWDSSPQPVKSFPWNRALENFIQLTLDLFVVVIKYLSIPLLAVSSLSEMSYCAHEKKLFLVPVPLLIGMAISNVLRETILELSPCLKVKWAIVVDPVLPRTEKRCRSIMASDCHLDILYFAQITWSLLSILGMFIYSSLCKWGTIEDSVVAFLWYRKPRRHQKQQH